MKKRPLKHRLRQLGAGTVCPCVFGIYVEDYLSTLGYMTGTADTDAADSLFSEDIREGRFLAESVYRAAKDPQRLYKLLVEPFARMVGGSSDEAHTSQK